MQDTQDDTTGTYESSGETPSTDEDGAGDDETDPESVSGDGAQGAGISADGPGPSPAGGGVAPRTPPGGRPSVGPVPSPADRYGSDVLATDWRAPKNGRATETPADLGLGRRGGHHRLVRRDRRGRPRPRHA